MNDLPIEVLAVSKTSSSIFFSPSAAALEGYAVYPLVEIDFEDILEALSCDFRINVDHLYLAKINFASIPFNDLNTFSRKEKFPVIHRSIFSSEIVKGEYLEALYVNNGVILVVLGDDESWLVIDEKRFPQRSSKLHRLTEMSKDNIHMMRKSEKFQEFFRP